MSVVPDVQDAAESVLARIRAAETAHRRHLEDIEAEAARRCELLIARAELDAELIRLQAHRSACCDVAAY